MTTSDKVAAVLTAGAVVSGTVGGFLVGAAAGFFVLGGFLFVIAFFMAQNETPAEVGE